MHEFNQWRKLLKEKKFTDTIIGDKVKIIPEQAEDKELAKQLETLLNHHLAEGNA